MLCWTCVQEPWVAGSGASSQVSAATLGAGKVDGGGRMALAARCIRVSLRPAGRRGESGQETRANRTVGRWATRRRSGEARSSENRVEVSFRSTDAPNSQGAYEISSRSADSGDLDARGLLAKMHGPIAGLLSDGHQGAGREGLGMFTRRRIGGLPPLPSHALCSARVPPPPIMPGGAIYAAAAAFPLPPSPWSIGMPLLFRGPRKLT